MNEQAIGRVISEYALEVASLRVSNATLQEELEQLRASAKDAKKDKERKE